MQLSTTLMRKPRIALLQIYTEINMARHLPIHCCGCNVRVMAELTDGKEIYPHREDLWSFPFWICRTCKNYVGCHHKTQYRTMPLGVIPTPEIRNARTHIHALIDPMWKSGAITRAKLYNRISKKLTCKFHTADIKSIEDARKIYKIIKKEILPQITNNNHG